MASTRHDDIAKRLADRIQQAPAKGRAMGTRSRAPSRPRDRRTTERPDHDGRVDSGSDVKPTTPATKRPPSQSSRRRSPPAKTSPTPAPTPPAAKLATGDLRRGAPGTALRGHLVPDALHRQARSRKVELRARLGRRVTWDHVVQSGLAMLVEEPELAPAMLDELRRTTDDSSRRRLVQATLSTELDRRLIELQLELSSRSERSVTYEQLWAAAVQLWLRSTA